jgi:hypothetical protein
MDKNELIDNIVTHLKGLDIPLCGVKLDGLTISTYMGYIVIWENEKAVKLCRHSYLPQRARELGFVGETGYQWGVEYWTGQQVIKLPNDLLIDVYTSDDEGYEWRGERKVIDTAWARVEAFRIIDQRFKPVEQNEIESAWANNNADIHECRLMPNELNWYDYDQQKAIDGRFPAHLEVVVINPKSGVQFEVVGQLSSGSVVVQRLSDGELCSFHLHQLKPTDHATRKAEADKKRCVDAVYKYGLSQGYDQSRKGLEGYYDKGFLRMPEDK